MPSTTRPDERFRYGIARAYGGALLFGLPIFMTSEMWALGFYMSRVRLGLLLLLTIPLLVGMSHYAGFEQTATWRQDLVDALVAYTVGVTTALGMLYLASVIRTGMPLREVIGKTVLQAIPGSIGALLAQSQLGASTRQQDKEKRRASYAGDILLMAIGSIYIAFNIAPTSEVVIIAQRASRWHAVGLAVVSLAVMHGFAYTMRFKGQAAAPRGTPAWSLFLRFTVVGYAVVLLLSGAMLWVFGRLDGLGAPIALVSVIVLALPGAVGAASARLVL